MRKFKLAALALAGGLCWTGSSQAAVYITEWMYNNTPEFVELTNMGPGAIDFTGWSFDDSSRTPGSESLSALGVVASGESVVLTEAADVAAFRTAWGLSASIKVIGGIANNLGRSDEINIYDSADALVDRLTYDDQGTGDVDGPRTQDISGNPSSLADLGINKASQWVLSFDGDDYGSVTSTGGQVGNPGYFAFVPEPASLALVALGGLALTRRKRTA